MPSSPSPEEQYPGLALLLGAYFHEDWALDDPTADDVVRRFRREGPRKTVRRAQADIGHVLRSRASEAELEDVLDRLGSYYRPAGDGRSARGWLTRVEQLLTGAG